MTGPNNTLWPELFEVLARAGDPDGFDAWQRRAKATGWCANPVRLVGASRSVDGATGELIGQLASAALPDRVLLKACGHRRATRCATCSATYQADAYQLVAAGLQGGKGIPETVAGHPMVFATLTAPSFGPVHTTTSRHTSEPIVCRPRPTGTCAHRQPRACRTVHDDSDPLVGQAICTGCFDYPGAVIWNAHAGPLWRRTTIAIRRALAALAGLTRSELGERVRVSYSKVVEYQRRGAIHVHAVIRLDNPAGPGQAPPAPFDTALLAAAIIRAATTVTVPCPDSVGIAGPIRWGTQLDVHPIGADGTIPKAVAGYLAKYATKSTDPAGHLDRRLRPGDLDRLDQQLNPHLARMVRTAWDLGTHPDLEHLRLRAWAHTLGFRGHWLTKSRAYSTTFAVLRAARHDWNLTKDGQTAREDVVTVGEWSYAGQGWSSQGDAWLAATAARQHTETRQVARHERRSTIPGEQH